MDRLCGGIPNMAYFVLFPFKGNPLKPGGNGHAIFSILLLITAHRIMFSMRQ